MSSVRRATETRRLLAGSCRRTAKTARGLPPEPIDHPWSTPIEIQAARRHRRGRAMSRRRCPCGRLLPRHFAARRRLCCPCDAARKRVAYWLDPERARRKQRARYWRNVDRVRAQQRRRAQTDRARAQNARAVARYQSRNPEKVKAHKAVSRLVASGELMRPDRCDVRGCHWSGETFGHHSDYDAPRDVVWVCRSHHERIHHDGPQPLKRGRRRRWAHPPKN